MTRTEIVKRAMSAIGQKTRYNLGSGAPFTALWPADSAGACDCSGFVCWVLGIPRHTSLFGWLTKLNGGWLNTDGMVEDAFQQQTGFFDEGARVMGDLIIYPSQSYMKGWRKPEWKYSPRIGHVGILLSDKRVVHCSAGNYRTTGDAIQQTSLDVFTKVPYAGCIKFAGVE